MRLGTLGADGATRAVVVTADGMQAKPVDGYEDVGALLRDPEGLAAARVVASDKAGSVPLESSELRAPVLAPGAVVCVGLNYRTHILEMGRELPTDPTLFSKLPRAMADPYADIAMPASEKIDYEAELAVVVGTGGRDIDPADAWDHIAGLTILNDVTARDFQRRTIQWFAGKTFQASTPWGPWIVTTDELGDISELGISLTVNGEERQRSVLGDLLFDVPTLVADLSRIITLEPGDVIATGTPGGVGHADGRYLGDGDTVTVEIDGIGELRNKFLVASR